MKYIRTEPGYQPTADSVWFSERYDQQLFENRLELAADKAAYEADIETIIMFKASKIPLPNTRLIKIANEYPNEFWESCVRTRNGRKAKGNSISEVKSLLCKENYKPVYSVQYEDYLARA